jgi:hypothetical protein
MLVNLFVKRGRYHQLHQFLQYHAITDSVHVACQLLSLESVYAPASQMALDMLSRLATVSTREQVCFSNLLLMFMFLLLLMLLLFDCRSL